MLGSQSTSSILLGIASLALVALADDQKGESNYDVLPADILIESQPLERTEFVYSLPHFSDKRADGAMPGVLRFGKRAQSFIRFGRSDGEMQKKEMPGVLRFGKRSMQEKKSMPGVLRFGKRSDMPGMLRFGKRDEIPGVLRFGKKSVPGVLRFGRK